MFRVNKSFLFEMPAALACLDSEASYYQLVEVTLDNPIWLVDVTSSEALHRRHKYLAHEIRIALEILSLDAWRSRALYALIPSPIAESGSRFRIKRCFRLWGVDEWDSGAFCWKLECDGEEVVLNEFDTQIDDHNWKLIWADVAAA